MDMQTYGSVIALEYRVRPSIDFADIVEEFDIAFQMVDSRTRSLSWDCNDIAIIDRDYVRVALGWLPSEDEGEPTHLIVAVGVSEDMGEETLDAASYEFLADRIVERTYEYLPFNAVLRGKASQPVSAELVDTTFDLLRMNAKEMPDDLRAPEKAAAPQAEPEQEDLTASMVPPWMATAEPDAGPTFAPADELAAELLGEDMVSPNGQVLLTRSKPTQPLRLTIHTLALSLMLYAPPLGAFMFAYSMLRDVFPLTAGVA